MVSRSGISPPILVEAYAQILANQVESTAQFHKLRDATFYGQEKKPLTYLPGVMNTVLHEIPVPQLDRLCLSGKKMAVCGWR